MKQPDLAQFDPADVERLAANFKTIAERSQRLLQTYLTQQPDGYSVADPGVIGRSFLELTQAMLRDPGKLAQQQFEYWQRSLQLWQRTSQRMLGNDPAPVVQPERGDRRFRDAAWAENAVFDFIKQSYLLTARSLHNAVMDVEGLSPKTREKVDFYTRQYVDAMAPNNFLLSNPQILQATLETGGENLLKGLANLLNDLQRGGGELRVAMTDFDAFELGVNIATTPGKVVYQNELMQLIQYAPTTKTVHRRPLLIIPPWINKFYILDLRPDNSFIRWAVDQGLTVFVISWVNPDERLAEADFEDYMLRGPIAALDAIEQATGVDAVNTIGYCIGGTLLGATLAYLQATGDKRVKSATFFHRAA